MAFKFVVFAAVIAVARAGVLGGPVGVAVTSPLVKTVVAEAPAQYDFGYSVSDPLTGDQKSQVESRQGDVVQGSYSLVDSDGTKRTVTYTADAFNGFNAVVSKEPLTVAAPVVTKTIAAPAVQTIAAPVLSARVGIAQPLARVGVPAPAIAYSPANLVSQVW